MKSYKVTYQRGHLIDVEFKRRVILVQGHEYIISGDSDGFTTEDEKLTIHESRDSKSKQAWVKAKYVETKLLYRAGEKLFFRVGVSKSIKGDKGYEQILLCTLLEDLYIYRMDGKKGVDPNDWRLAECNCELESCLLGDLRLTEKVKAESLNKLFSQTVMFYFSNQRSGAANALKTFFLYKPGMHVTFDDVLHHHYQNLDDVRNDLVTKKESRS